MPPLSQFVPTGLLFFIVIGAGVLWSRTRRVSSLAQFVASLFVFSGFALEQVRWFFVLPADQSVFADVMRSGPMHVAMSLAQLLGSVTFSVGYFCHAIRPNASNQAMQRTAGRSDI